MNRKLLATAICASLLATGTAYAQDTTSTTNQPQDQTTTAQPSQDQSQATQSSTNTPSQTTASSSNQTKVKTLQAVTVTGSLLKRPEYQTTVPVQVVNIKAQKAAGAFGTADILQSTAVGSAATQINNQFSGFVIGGGTGIQTIDLRGLGANRTLVLLDGQRPGPAGVQGQTGNGFDLNVIPEVILQRVEIVKDGSSSIYGSDAISGVVNLITKKRLDHLQLNVSEALPQHGGSSQTNASIGTGWNFNNGNILFAAQFSEQFPLALRQRDFLKCSQDLIFGAGKRIDEKDLSINAGTPVAGCKNILINTIINASTGVFLVPTKDGSTIGNIPGFVPETFGNYADGNPNGAFDTVPYDFPSPGSDTAWAINKNRNSSAYAFSHFTFGPVNWTNQVLFDHRQTDTKGWRQFFPVVINAADPTDSSVYEPVMPYPLDQQVNINYYYLRTKLDGGFGNSSWSWQVNLHHSHSSGSYSHLGIDSRKSGDLGGNGVGNTVPDDSSQVKNYFTEGYLTGADMNQLIDEVGEVFTGHTTYEQSTANAIVNGELFNLPAGPVSAAIGAEYRHFKINDQPDPVNSAGFEWGFSSAQVTKGADHVTEEFAEFGVPVLQGIPGFQSLSLDLSARRFKYASVGSSSHVWKYGLNWQITPTWRVRGTIGTSYRAPGLFELYLGNQSGFVGQLGIDPCINWGKSTNDFIRANCAAIGIPNNYAGGGATAQIFSGGGKGFLTPETSRAKSLGFVWTPTFGNFNLALDYFDYDIHGEIGTLSAKDIVNSCYSAPVFPNTFCTLFSRNPGNATVDPNAIENIHATFININRQRTRGYDLQVNYSNDLSFGRLSADAEVTYTLENTQQLFSSASASGFNATDFVGFIGNPRVVGLAHVILEHGNWTWTLQEHYVGSTEDKLKPATFTYFGYAGAIRDIRAKYQFRSDLSLGYNNGKWGATVGIRNVFDTQPDLISAGIGGDNPVNGFGRIGIIPNQATQYDWFGRTLFVKLTYDIGK